MIALSTLRPKQLSLSIQSSDSKVLIPVYTQKLSYFVSFYHQCWLLLLIYSSLHSCWLNQFGTQLELAIDEQQQLINSAAGLLLPPVNAAVLMKYGHLYIYTQLQQYFLSFCINRQE